MDFSALKPWRGRIRSILRIMAALLFMQHGTQKILSFPAEAGFPVAGMSYAAGLIELIGGLLLAIGLFSRPAVFLMSGMCAVGYFLVHAPKGFFPIQNGGELIALYCFVFLYLFFAGPGPWSVDAIRKRGLGADD